MALAPRWIMTQGWRTPCTTDWIYGHKQTYLAMIFMIIQGTCKTKARVRIPFRRDDFTYRELTEPKLNR